MTNVPNNHIVAHPSVMMCIRSHLQAFITSLMIGDLCVVANESLPFLFLRIPIGVLTQFPTSSCSPSVGECLYDFSVDEASSMKSTDRALVTTALLWQKMTNVYCRIAILGVK